jgi:hypothetical protein
VTTPAGLVARKVTLGEPEAIHQDITATAGYSTRVDKLKTIGHVCALKRIHADHWLARERRERLLAATAVLDATLDLEQRRVNSRVQRLRRTRNAAIHGGTLSEVACATIADFAAYFAHQALNATISCYQLVQSGLVSNFTTMKIITVWAEAKIATTRLSGAA